ncbi:Aste57867_9378 [Aphanomyces stellatus]|uniref:Aste57867_9378 protein n=1 Tax=Aphanomyces stellatus TaxID=120398 RepID=A0A485KN23_9STRA|nr:hypothetical protein As57867_009342 [Aphanomyces stellatus]VFT86259.1 Aste57867_9378 [Aphanomyces stellatus]
MTNPCYFNKCKNAAMAGSTKCDFHRKKGICKMQPCRNQVYQEGLCIRHGARNRPCRIEGCAHNLRVRGLCSYHATVFIDVPTIVRRDEAATKRQAQRAEVIPKYVDVPLPQPMQMPLLEVVLDSLESLDSFFDDLILFGQTIHAA